MQLISTPTYLTSEQCHALVQIPADLSDREIAREPIEKESWQSPDRKGESEPVAKPQACSHISYWFSPGFPARSFVVNTSYHLLSRG